MAETYDCIVLGVGGFGSAALDALARRGARVLGLEQFGVAHERGSSHGQTRIIRRAYFEHPDYVPLVTRAFGMWAELEQDVGRTLYQPTGLFLAGPPDGEAVAGTLRAAREHALPIEQVAIGAARERFPQFRFDEAQAVVYEGQAGYLRVEECVRAHIERAVRNGARLECGVRVVEWSVDRSSVRVRTDRAEHLASRLVVTAGPWSRDLLAGLGVTLRVLRKVQFWHRVDPAAVEGHRRSPAFLFELPAPVGTSNGAGTLRVPSPRQAADREQADGTRSVPATVGPAVFYGFPSLDAETVKVAEHSGGIPVADPTAVDRERHEDDVRPVRDFVRERLPHVAPEPFRHSVCMYTMSPDGHFIVDRHRQHQNVVFAAGFSGHGFKFTPVIGAALADLALHGATTLPIKFLHLDRPALCPASDHSH
jgi:sarcosine oxidase